MQRMLTGLVVVLAAFVGILGIAVLNLWSDISALQSRRGSEGSGSRGLVVQEGPDSIRVKELEGRVTTLQREIGHLRNSVRAARNDAAAAVARRDDDDRDDRLDGPSSDIVLTAPDRQKDGAGKFLISEEDEDFFIAIQDRVQRRRRIDGMTRNVMRRVDRLASRGEIQALPDDRREVVEKTIRKYVVAGDDLVTTYVRDPVERIRGMTSEERRDMLANERSDLVAAAQQDLVPLLGEIDAAKVAEQSLQSPWGGRRRNSGLKGKKSR